MTQVYDMIEHSHDVLIVGAGAAGPRGWNSAFAAKISARNSAADLPQSSTASIEQRAIRSNRRRRSLVTLFAAALPILLGAPPALGANTDIYPDFAFASAPGWQYQNYFDFANHGSVNSFSETPFLAYYTKTGITGSTKDSFEYWVSGAFGYQSPLGVPGVSGWGVSSPNVAVEWYYNLIQSDKKVGSSGYEALTISPWLEVFGPNGDTQATGFGSGLNQWSGNGTLLLSYRKERFTTTLLPIALTYSGSNLNSMFVTNPDGSISLAKARVGWTGTFGLVNVGYDVTPTVTLAVQQVWNVYSFADARYSPRTSEGTIGPQLAYTGLSDAYGIYIAGAVQVDYYHSRGLPQSVYVTTYVTKSF
jgi:hypothetical protein